MTHEETRHLMDGILSVRGRMPGLTIVFIEHEMGVMSVSPIAASCSISPATDRCKKPISVWHEWQAGSRSQRHYRLRQGGRAARCFAHRRGRHHYAPARLERFRLSKGRVVAAGRPDELARRAGVREAYFG
jgi:hypothetical protein